MTDIQTHTEAESRRLRVAVGRSRFDRVWRNTEMSWSELRDRLAADNPTEETMAEYRAMGRARQTQVKDVGGFVGGYLRHGLRKGTHIETRSVVTLDYDSFHAGRLDDIRRALPCRWALHSTHKHRDDDWRVRLVVPMSRDVTVDEYGAVARRVAERVGFDGIDRSTFEACRLMFWPSRPVDAPRLFEEGTGGSFLDVEAVLGSYADWRDQSAWPLLPGEETALRLFTGGESGGESGENGASAGYTGTVERAEAERIYAALTSAGHRASDPWQKPGIVGAFCRAYSVGEAIAGFLPGVYTAAGRNRWTHCGSSTTGGALELDGGRFLYSFHGTDPVCGKLLNAWDLVRLHRFGEMDAGSDRETRAARLPSYRAMEELALGDGTVKRRLAEERRARAAGDFAGISLPEEEEGEREGERKGEREGEASPGEKREGESAEERRWREVQESLPYNKDGSVKATITAVATIVANDPELRGRLRYNEFTGDTDVSGPLPWKRQGKVWTNADDACLRAWFDRKWGLSGKDKIYDGFMTAVTAAGYHPVKEYLEGLVWDGTKRLGRIFADVLGAADTPLNARLGELIFGAAVTRIYRPGTKFDYFVILQGPEGCGKSSLFQIMGGEWFSDSVVTIEGKEGMEAVQGVWIAEIGELIGVKRSETSAVKAFISRLVDKYRPAYGRVRESRPRQCVIVGTTNEELFLRGITTGNRRSPVVEVRPELRRVPESVREWTELWRDQLWAEAVTLYRAGMPLWLNDEEEEAARLIRDEHNLDLQNPLFGEVSRFLDMWLPAGWEGMDRGERAAWLTAHPDGGNAGGPFDNGYVRRDTVTIPEILQEGLGMKRSDRDYLAKSREVGQFLNTLKGEWRKGGGKRTKSYGYQKVWMREKEQEEPCTLDDL